MATGIITKSEPIFRLPLIGEIARTQRIIVGWTAVFDDDFSRHQLMSSNWYRLKIGYASGRFPSLTAACPVYLHHVIFEHYFGSIVDGCLVDHIDRDKLNNLPSNLRATTHAINRVNKGRLKSNTSGFHGVSWAKRERKWVAYIDVRGKRVGLGYYDIPRVAADAVNAAYQQHYPEVPIPNP